MNEEQEYYALTRKAFDFLAPVYEWMTLPLRQVRLDVVDFSEVLPGAKVLDVATGTGRQAFAFARHGCKVTAVDLTESMLVRARRRNREGGVQFEVGDATRLRFESGSFDIACVSFALHDMPIFIREKVIHEMVRVTKISGRLIFVDYGLPQNRLGQTLVRGFVSLYEGKYYDEFILSDLPRLLVICGIEIEAERRILAGAGRIWKTIKTSVDPVGPGA